MAARMSAPMMPMADIAITATVLLQGCSRILGNLSGRGRFFSGVGFRGFGDFGWGRATSLFHSSAVGRGSTMSLYHSSAVGRLYWFGLFMGLFLLDYGEMGC